MTPEWGARRLADYVRAHFDANPPMPDTISIALRDFATALTLHHRDRVKVTDFNDWVTERAKLSNKTEAEMREITRNLQDIFDMTERDVMDYVEEVERA